VYLGVISFATQSVSRQGGPGVVARGLNRTAPLKTDGGACFPFPWFASTSEEWTRLKEVAVFQMIDQASAGPQDRKTTLMKVACLSRPWLP